METWSDRAAAELLEQMEITAQEIERRKEFLEFGAEDIQVSVQTCIDALGQQVSELLLKGPPRIFERVVLSLP